MEAGRTQPAFQNVSVMLEGNSTLKSGSFEESFIETTPHVVVRPGTAGCHYHRGLTWPLEEDDTGTCRQRRLDGHSDAPQQQVGS